MNKIKETITTMWLAAKYSFTFCWRNSKKETIGRIMIAIFGTVLMYAGIQSTGMIINSVQSAVEVFKGKEITFVEMMTGGLMWPISFLAIIILLGVLIGIFNWFCHSRWRNILRFANSKELYDHRATLDVARFKSKEFDDLIKRISELPGSWNTRISFSEEMLSLFTLTTSFVIFGASLLWYQPYYALILLVGCLPMAIVEFKTVSMWWNLFLELVPEHKKRYVLEKSYQAPLAFLQALMFNQMPSLRKEIDINTGGVMKSYDKVRNITFRNEILTNLVAVIATISVVIHAIWSTVINSAEVGTLMIIIAAIRTFQGNIQQIISLVAEQWNSAKGVILIEKDFFGMKSVIKTENPVEINFSGAPFIEFSDVSFAYPDTDTLALKKVNFIIPPGKKVAIVGESGNGKSTILALLMRYYDPTSGYVFANGINLQNIDPREWSYVASSLTQEYSVAERTISSEIASSRLDQDVDMEIVAESARFADFMDVADSKPDGIDSQIGIEFGGVEFSGGERQRLALARVHYRKTPILILDEPDSKLDPHSAQRVTDNIFDLKDSTVILITHHVSLAKRADMILVMKDGEVAEQGTHSELMSKDGVYTSLYNQDKKRYSTDS